MPKIACRACFAPLVLGLLISQLMTLIIQEQAQANVCIGALEGQNQTTIADLELAKNYGPPKGELQAIDVARSRGSHLH